MMRIVQANDQDKYLSGGETKMAEILSWILVIVMGLLGGIPTVYITLSIPVIIAQKIIKKAKTGGSLFD